MKKKKSMKAEYYPSMSAMKKHEKSESAATRMSEKKMKMKDIVAGKMKKDIY